MITVYYQNNLPCTIRPTPFVSISYSAQRNKIGTFGGTYDITLTGTIIDSEGSPIHTTNITSGQDSFVNDYARPDSQSIGLDQSLRSILEKQNAIRELFSMDGQKIEIAPISNDPGNNDINTGGPDEAIITFYPTVQSINFEEGIYVNTCKYTITLKADVLLDQANNVLMEGSIANTFANNDTGGETQFHNSNFRNSQENLINIHGGFIEDFSESWSIEVDDQNAITDTNNENNGIVSLKSYRLTRNISATGKVTYSPSGGTVVRHEAWEQAKNFIKKKIAISSDGFDEYPKYSTDGVFAKDFLNLSAVFGGYSHSRTENIDQSNGQYSIVDTWLISSGTAYENYNMNISSSLDGPFISVSIQGTIKGLSTLPVDSVLYGGTATGGVTAYTNAVNKYREISNNASFGLTCPLYKRVSNAIYPVIPNAQPRSLSLGLNEFTGEITYNIEYNNRPMNFLSGVLSENISVSDTYPGDIFAVIPVIGRQTGPILQYIGGRTEYQRSVGIEFTVGYSDLPYGRDRINFVLSKPSLNEPIRSQINSLITALSPANEPGVRKYFLSPPSESWNPKEGRYSLNLNWTYELDH
jgi:hypothetical protein